jgi:hypothetical protein
MDFPLQPSTRRNGGLNPHSRFIYLNFLLSIAAFVGQIQHIACQHVNLCLIQQPIL